MHEQVHDSVVQMSLDGGGISAKNFVILDKVTV